jgi:F0F1-type ATP synthase assembly protein I
LTRKRFRAYNRLALLGTFGKDSRLLRDSLSRLYLKAVLLQVAVSVPVVLLAWMLSGPHAALSAVVGGMAVVLGGAAYGLLARESRVTAVGAGAVLRKHVFAEVIKVVVVAGVMLVAFASGWFAPVWLMVAMVVALLGHWLLVFLIR